VTALEPKVLDEFPYEKLLVIQEGRFADMANFKAFRLILEDFDLHQRKIFFKDANHYVWDDPYFFKIGEDNFL